MGTKRTAALAFTSLLFLAPEVSAQILVGPRRPPRILAETQPAVGVLAGPTSRAADSDTGGLEFAVFGEKPIDRGWRARGEIGVALWDTTPAFTEGATRISLTRATAGLYRVHGHSGMHSFAGGGVGLYGHHVANGPGSGVKGGVHAGMGIEIMGARHGFSTEVRVGVAPKPSAPLGGVLHASILFGVKRVMR